MTAHGSFCGEPLQPVFGFCTLRWRQSDQVGLLLVCAMWKQTFFPAGSRRALLLQPGGEASSALSDSEIVSAASWLFALFARQISKLRPRPSPRWVWCYTSKVWTELDDTQTTMNSELDAKGVSRLITVVAIKYWQQVLNRFQFYTASLRTSTTPDLLLVQQLQHLEPNGHAWLKRSRQSENQSSCWRQEKRVFFQAAMCHGHQWWVVFDWLFDPFWYS